MAFDGIVTRGIVRELKDLLVFGKIDKVQQPAKDELLITVHTKTGNHKLFASSSSSAPRLHLIEEAPPNPPVPPPFCMLMRKHLVGARIVDITQHEADRIIEISLEALNELGFTLSKKLIVEIMGKHSNIILVELRPTSDSASTNPVCSNPEFESIGSTEYQEIVIDSIKRVSFDTSRVRQILPGIKYSYPPAQEKTPFDEISEDELNNLPSDSGIILKKIGGISPQIAEELAITPDRFNYLRTLYNYGKHSGKNADSVDINDAYVVDINEEEDVSIERIRPHIYLDDNNSPIDFHIANLTQYEDSCTRKDFDTLSQCIDYYFEHKESTNRIKQRSHSLSKTLDGLLEKYKLKLQRLNEDLLAAEDSEKYRLYGELLTANLHNVTGGLDKVTLTSYYDGSEVTIPLDPKYSPSKNAQNYFKKYGKSKTAVKEKRIQIEETEKDIQYLESVQTSLDNLTNPEDIEFTRSELVETGYIRKRKTNEKPRKFKASPHKYTSPSGFDILVGRNNKENDELTLRIADKTDIWLHTKDIPGSHVIIRTNGEDPTADDIYCAASIAAWHSKAKDSGQVPVDYVKVRHVKKPAGAKPGMVIFTDNRTVYVEPKLP